MYSETEIKNEIREFAKMLAPAVGDDSLRVCKLLYRRYSKLSGILSADVAELEGLVGSKAAMHIKILGYITSRRLTERFEFGCVHTESEIVEYLKALFLGLSVEHFYLISFGKAGEILSADRIGVGCVNSAAVVPRNVVETAIKRNAKSVVLAHNHPGGKAKASQEDNDLNSKLSSVLEKAGIQLTGHFVVAGGDCEFIVVNGEL